MWKYCQKGVIGIGNTIRFHPRPQKLELHTK